MATTTFHTSSVILADNQANPPTEIRLAYAPGQPQGHCQVEFLRNGTLVAVPFVFKMSTSGGRVAGEAIATDPEYVVVDANDLITDG